MTKRKRSPARRRIGPLPPPLATFRSPVLSLWQSAIDEVSARQAAAQPRTLGESTPAASATAPLMLQSIAAAQAILKGQPGPEAATLGPAIADCAQLYLQLIIAEARGDMRKVDELRNEIAFSTCDPLWAAVLIEYEKFRLQRGSIPYRRYEQLDDYVLPLPGGGQSEIKIALIADWGTGTLTARQLLADLAQHTPDVLIHLGDIYYSGTAGEVQQRFLAACQTTPGLNIPIFTLAGNHDMYSGGAGYYWLLDQLNQPASYFCLRNADWQVLAMDTGLNDSDPGTILSNLTTLDDQEVTWHRHKIQQAGGRRTVLLSHHQLFSSASGVGANSAGSALAVNPNLYAAFGDLLGEVALWMWGHEHNLVIFDEYVGLARGRCIGSGAIPTLVDQHPYTPNLDLVLPQGQSSPPHMNLNIQLGTHEQFYNHAYAVLTLAGRAAHVTYYQLLPDGRSEVLFEEPIGMA
jgi:predicted phosphodiesterase